MVDSRKSLTIDFLPVGQGDGILITCPNGEMILVDLGSKPGCKVWKKTGEYIIKYLINQIKPRTKLDYLILTHPHDDHWNHVPEFLTKLSEAIAGEGKKIKVVDTVYVGGTEKHYKKDNASINITKADTKCHYGAIESLAKGYSEIIPNMIKKVDCSDVSILVLWANDAWGKKGAKDVKANDNSIVLRLEYAGKSVILAGDVTLSVKQKILERAGSASSNILQCNILKIAHHGEGSPKKKANKNEAQNQQEYLEWREKYENWLTILGPEQVFISAGFNQRFGHPSQSALYPLLDATSLNTEDVHEIVFFDPDLNTWLPHETNVAIYTSIDDLKYKDQNGNHLQNINEINAALDATDLNFTARACHWQVKIFEDKTLVKALIKTPEIDPIQTHVKKREKTA